MVTKKIFLGPLLMLAGCSHLVQDNASPANSPNLVPHYDGPCHVTHDPLKDILDALIQATGPYSAHPIHIDNRFSITNYPDYSAAVTHFAHAAEDKADAAIICITNLTNTFTTFFSLNPNNPSSLIPSLLDISNHIKAIYKRIDDAGLRTKFVDFHAAFFGSYITREALAQLGTAYATCALGIAKCITRLASATCVIADNIRRHPDHDRTSNVTIHRIYNATHKTIFAAHIAAVVAHLIAALTAEDHAILHAHAAATAAYPVQKVVQAIKAAHEANKAASDARNAANIAFTYHSDIQQVPIYVACVLPLAAAATAAATRATHTAVCMNATLYTHATTALYAHATTYVKHQAINANVAATAQLNNIINNSRMNQAALDLGFAKTALAVHCTRVASSTSTSSG